MVRIPFFDFDEPAPEPTEDPATARAAADAAHEAADQAAREVLYGREHAYAIRFGNDALSREQPALAAIDRGYRAARAGLGPEARAAFDAGADASRQAWRDQVQGRAAAERAKLKLESARLREHYAAYDLYQAVDRRDHDAAGAHADLLHEAALRHGQLSGLDPAAAQAQAAGKVGQTLTSGITRVAAADPQAAQAALDRHGARMGDDHRATAQAAMASGPAAADPTSRTDGGMRQLNAMGPLNSAGLPVNHYIGPDGEPQPVRRAPPPQSSPPPRQQRQRLHDLADKAVDLARKKVREGKAWAEDKADQLRDDAIGFAVDEAMRFPEPRKAAPPLMRAWEIAEGHGGAGHRAAPPQGTADNTDDLGVLARRWEIWGGASDQHQPGRISPGAGDAGGPSYGSYQLATNAGSPWDFLQRQGHPWAKAFAGLHAGTPEFEEVWKRVSAQDPIGFAKAQHEYAVEAYYLPQARLFKRIAGIDLAGRSLALRNVVLSTAIQMSPTGKGYAQLVKHLNDEEGGHASDEQIIVAIYAKRFKLDVQGHPANFSSSPALAKGLTRRSEGEPAQALEMLRNERLGTRPRLQFSAESVK